MAAMGRDERGTGWWVKHGIAGGIVAGIVMLLFEMLSTALMAMSPFMPPRMMAGIVVGAQAMEESFPLGTALATALMLHFLLSVTYGVLFALIVRPQGKNIAGWAVWAEASFFGLLIWLVNFYIFAPLLGWRWFPEGANPFQQFVAHTFAFGTVLGAYLERTMPRRRVPSVA